jgi:hypothetical protein
LSIAVTLDDVSISPHAQNIRISKSRSARDTAIFQIRATKATPNVGQRIGIFDHGVRFFGGTIDEIKKIPIAEKAGSEAWYECLCVGWALWLDRHQIPAAAYSDMAAGAMVQKIITDWAQFEIFIGAILQGASASELGVKIFRGVSVWTAIEELAQASGYIAYIDPDLHFYFTPPDYKASTLEITAANTNYRQPEVREDRSDYFNKVSIAINHEAFAPFVLDLPGDQTHPAFQVYDPSDSSMVPVDIDVIRRIALNGIDQTFAVKGSGQTATFYWTQGLARIEWDSASATPSPADRITVEFWKVGANIVTASDGEEISARYQIEQGSGTYHAYMEDFDLKDATVAEQRANEFLDLHCPGRTTLSGKVPGDLPIEYRWVVYSNELFTGSQSFVTDLFPGRLIKFHPSTPISTSQNVIIQSVEIELLPKSQEFRYEIIAIDATELADFVEFYKGLAELGPGAASIKDFPSQNLGRLAATFGISGAVSVADDVTPHVEISLPDGYVFRCVAAWVNLNTPAVGADFKADLRYSTNDYDTALGSITWSNVFETANGDLVLPAGQLKRQDPLGKFSGFPTALEFPAKSLVRMDVKQVGSTTAGSDLTVQLVGEIRKA